MPGSDEWLVIWLRKKQPGRNGGDVGVSIEKVTESASCRLRAQIEPVILKTPANVLPGSPERKRNRLERASATLTSILRGACQLMAIPKEKGMAASRMRRPLP